MIDFFLNTLLYFRVVLDLQIAQIIPIYHTTQFLLLFPAH